MAFSRSVIRSQAPAKCGICETDRTIKWKCIDCDNLLCNNCKEKVHQKLQNAMDHQVVNIKDVGQPMVVALKINNQFQTELSTVGNISYGHDYSLWICSAADNVLQRVKPEGTKLNILSSYDIKVKGMAFTHSNDLVIAVGRSKLKQISSKTGSLTDSVYKVSLFNLIAVHITSDNKVLVGCVNKDYPKPGRRVVILMNQNGVHERVYEHDQHKQPIFTYPWRITYTSNGNIFVMGQGSDDRDRVVVLGQDCDIINNYTGNTEINKDISFKLRCLVTTPRDNVIVADINTHTLHFLNNAGLLMTYYKIRDINIIFPWSLTFSPSGQLYIGCCSPPGGKNKVAKIYEVAISGC